jgi:hypothetical protein
MDKNSGYGRESSHMLMAVLDNHHTDHSRVRQAQESMEHRVGVLFDRLLVLPTGISSREKHLVSQNGDMRMKFQKILVLVSSHTSLLLWIQGKCHALIDK